MTTQLPMPKERLEKIASWRETYGAGHNVMLPAEEAEALARALLAAYEQEPVFFVEIDGDDWINAGRIEGKDRPDLGLLPDGINYLYANPAPSIPAVPDGYVLMPMKLTAESGAKYVLSGEFHVLHRVTCHECGGEGCSDCDDDGWLEEKIMIGWDDIKDIYRAAVEACSIKSTGEGV